MISGNCCMGGAHRRRLARRLSGTLASVLPGAALTLLPKCPLCVAAWLGAAGVGLSASTAMRVRGGILVFSAVALCCVAARMIRRALRPSPSLRLSAGQPCRPIRGLFDGLRLR